MKSLVYALDGQEQRVRLCDSVLVYMDQYMQRSSHSCEAGGQLFARINRTGDIQVEVATGPKKKDKRSRFGFILDKVIANYEIRALFDQGLHYVGDWHTHPQSCPIPSETDILSMKELFRLSSHDHNSFLMLILGTMSKPDGLWISQHNESEYRKLLYVGQEDCCQKKYNGIWKK